MKLTIITPCSRPRNLSIMLDAINSLVVPYFETEWLVVFDSDNLGEMVLATGRNIEDFIASGARLSIYKGEGLSGNPQRNRALNLMEPTDLVYFLDDDNIPHNSMFEMASNGDKHHAWVFCQRWKFGQLRLLAHPDSVKPCLIDTAQFILPYSFIGEKRWEPWNYCADGAFFSSIYEEHREDFLFSNDAWCWYNYLR